MMQKQYAYMDSLFLDSLQKLDNLNLVSERELQVQSVKHGVYLPAKKVSGVMRAGVVDADRQYVSLSAFEARSEVDGWGGSYDFEDAEIVHKKVMYFGRFWRHWGHFIMDEVTRLWYAVFVDPEIIIAYDGTDEVLGVYEEFFRLLGISKKQLLSVSVPTQFDKIVIPECAHKPGLEMNVAFKKMFDKAAEQALKEYEDPDKYKGKKVYLTRTAIPARVPMELGEKQIEKIHRDNGYIIVSPEKFSLVEQIVMYRTAEEFACVSGTLPHNMMFAADGTRVTVFRKSNKPVYRQWDVNQIRDLNLTNVDAHISLRPVGAAGPFLLDLNKNARRYFRNHGFIFRYNWFAEFFVRKGKVLWYIPVYFARKRKNVLHVPIFDGEKFTTTESASKELFWYYFKRI